MALKQDASPAAQAVLSHVHSGSYPEADSVVTSVLSADDLSSVKDGLLSLRLGTEADIRKAGHAAGTSTDPWIQRAETLRLNVENASQSSQSVIRTARAAEQCLSEHRDAAQKALLLRREIAFTKLLEKDLGSISRITSKLRQLQSTVSSGEIESSIELLHGLEALLEDVRELHRTNAVELVKQRLEDIRGILIQKANSLWASAFSVNKSLHRLVIQRQVLSPQTGADIPIDHVVHICASLNVMESNCLLFARDIQNGIFIPLLTIPHEGESGKATSVQTTQDTLTVLHSSRSSDQETTLIKIMAVFSFMKTQIPDIVSRQLSSALVPGIIERLTSSELSSEISPYLTSIAQFESLIAEVTRASATLESYQWPCAAKMTEWASQAPRLWLSRRREASIASVRQSLSKGLDDLQQVEHVESEEIPLDEVVIEDGQENDWNNDWTEGSVEAPGEGQIATRRQETSNAGGTVHDEEEDAEGAEADWGWGEREEDAESAPAPHNGLEPTADQAMPAGHLASVRSTRHVTLKEYFRVTTLPDALFEVIEGLIRDAKQLDARRGTSLNMAPVAGALYSIPTLVIATFKALAPAHYDLRAGGLMLLYNDVSRLTDKLDHLSEDVQKSDPAASGRLKLDTDIESLKSFSRRSYGRAMDAERTIVSDMIDNAQGFVDCTVQPQATACADAVAMTVAYVQSLNSRWSPLLSRSVLRQSLGSVLDSIINKVILNIEDLTDIGDDESKRLRRHCEEIAKLDVLFSEQKDDTTKSAGADSRSLTNLYVPSWFKFQYLMEILESSLADIKYLWTETGLHLEFEPDEVVDLIKALFADNEHRKRAIAEMRAG